MTKTNSMSNVMLADYYKLKKLKSVWIGLIVMFLLLLLGYCAYWAGIKIVESRPINPADPEADIMKDQTIAYLGTIRTAMLYGSTSTVRIELFVAIIACIFIGKDFSCGATAIYTARGTKRAQTYFSKLFSLITLFVAFESYFYGLGSTVTHKKFFLFDTQKLPKNREFLAWDLFCNIDMELVTGLEPATCSLRMSCTTNCATQAQ